MRLDTCCSDTRKELPKKVYVAGLIRNSKAMAFPLRKIPRGKLVEVEIGEQTIKVIYEKNSRLFFIKKLHADRSGDFDFVASVV